MNTKISSRRLRFRRPSRGLFLSAWCALSLLFLGAQDTSDNSPGNGNPDQTGSARATGHLIRVPLPITGEVDTRVKGMINEVVARVQPTERRPILILEFRGDDEGSPKAGSQFERSLSLARYLAGESLNQVRTVAYLSGTIHGHTVLPVLACEEIIAHPGAELGQAGIDEEFVDDTVRRGYSEIAERRRTVPVPIVMGMLDGGPAVYKVKTLDGVRYVSEDKLEELQKTTAVESVNKVIPEGEMGSFSGGDLRMKLFASHLARDRVELATALGLPVGGIDEDPTLGQGRKALRVDLTGPIKSDKVTWAERSIRGKIERDDVNFVCLTVNSAGGSPHDSVRLALYLAGLDPSEVRTVAFVESQARADAALIALACDQLVVTKSSVLGGPGRGRIGARKLDDMQSPIREIAQAKHRGWSLLAAMVDSELSVQQYSHRGTGQVRCFCTEELAEQKDADDWQARMEVDTQSGLKGSEAINIHLAKFDVDDFEELRTMYHLTDEIESAEPTWAHWLVEFLASPKVAGALLFIGWFALMIEFMSPGLSVAGFTSAVCFLVFFWANFLNGTAGWLEITLFAGGVICVAMEIFVIPGLGAFGIGGGVLIVASIVMATQTFVIPRNSYEWNQVPTSLALVVAAGAGAIASLLFMRRVLTEAPVFRRVSLETPDDERLERLRYQESLVHFDHLVGKHGVTTTQLTPSGKARFGDEVIDVMTDGEVLPPGTDVCVMGVKGNEVEVRPVRGDDGSLV